MKKLTALERLIRTLNFKDTDTVATGEIFQNSEIISRFAGRKINDDWTLDELAATYRGLEIDTGLLIAPAAKPCIEERIGNLKQLMADLVGCGIDGINPCEKRNISIDYVRNNYPNLVIRGGIDQFELLPQGNKEEVEAEVQRVIDICKDGGLILGSDGEIHPKCRADNVITMFKKAKSIKFN